MVDDELDALAVLDGLAKAAGMLDAAASTDPALSRVARALREIHETDGRADFNEVVGLRQHGGVPTWRKTAIDRRNAILRHIRATHYGNLPISAAAATIAKKWERYAITFLPSDALPAPGTENAEYNKLCRYNEEPLTPRRIATILSAN